MGTSRSALAGKIAPLLLLAAAAAAVVCWNAPLRAQTQEQEQAFDYNPGGEEPALAQPAPKPVVEMVVDDDVIVTKDPQGYTKMYSKTRWKSWVERVIYLLLLDIAVLAILASLSKTDEYNLAISYFVSGISFLVCVWIALCALLLFILKSATWTFVLPLAGVLGAVTYFLLMRVKSADISLAELKDSFKGRAGGAGTDERLASVDASPGDWQDQDFLK